MSANEWQLAGWEVLGRIARGSTADVLLARPDLTGEVTPASLTLGLSAMDQRVVLKRLYPHLAANEDFVRAFVDEVRLMSLVRHDGVVDVFDLDEDDESFYAVLELVDGPSLSAALRLRAKQHGSAALDVDTACAVVARVCAALDVVHNVKDPQTQEPLQLVHRDVNPQNVLLGRDDVVKLADFGVARSATGRKNGILAARDTNGGVLKGKASFLAPEVLKAAFSTTGQVDARADLFATGVTLHLLLSGALPFVGDSDVELLDCIAHKAPPALPTTLPKALTSLVTSLLEKSPSARPQTAKEVQAALAPWSGGDVGRFVRGLGLPSLRS